MAYVSHSHLKYLHVAWVAAGLDPAIGDLLADARARMGDITQQRDAFTRDCGERELASRIARGELSVTQAVASHTARGQREAAGMLARAAAGAVIGQVAAQLQALGDRLITEHLAPREATVYADAAKPVEVIGDILDPTAAFAGGATTTKAWHDLTDLLAVTDELTKVHVRLAGFHALTGGWEQPTSTDERGWVLGDEKAATAYDGGVNRVSRPRHVHPVRRFADRVLTIGPRVYVEPTPRRELEPVGPDTAA